jgi:hypothetical protein
MNFAGWDITTGDFDHILKILRATPTHCAPFIRRKYNAMKKSHSRRTANLWIVDLLEKAAKFKFKLGSDDQAIKDKALMQAKWSKMTIYRASSEQDAFAHIVQTLLEFNIPAPKAKTTRGVLGRVMAEKWWRRKIRNAHGRAMEAFAREIGMVNSRNQVYVSDATLYRRRKQRAAARLMLELFEMVNELEQKFDLVELVDKSVSNPEIRRHELMCRIAGNEQIAKDKGLVGDFYTVTVPGRMHSHYGKSGDAIKSYDGTTTQQAQAALNSIWAKIRSALKRKGLDFHGVRVTEPHKDGTPHWHLLIFMKKEDRKAIRDVFEHYALELDPNESGAKDHRFKIDEIDYSKGSATAYIAKYISKNIDGYMLDDDQFGGNAKNSAERVEAWASTWGIRQFQFFGNPPVTIWRELRRLEKSSDPVINEAILAADSNDWALYMVIMGGPNSLRNQMPIHLEMCHSGRFNEYEEEIPDFVIGVRSASDYEISRDHSWEMNLKSAGSEKLATGGDCGHLEFCQ